MKHRSKATRALTVKMQRIGLIVLFLSRKTPLAGPAESAFARSGARASLPLQQRLGLLAQHLAQQRVGYLAFLRQMLADVR